MGTVMDVKRTSGAPSDKGRAPWRSWLQRTPTWVEVAGLLLAIAAIVVPLVVATGGSTSTSTGGTKPGAGAAKKPKPEPEAKLEVDSFTAGDGTVSDPRPRLEAILHNVGHRRAVVDGAAVSIEAVHPLERCAPQGDIPLSETYGLVLPHRADPADALTLPLHDQVAPDGADRLAIALSTRLSKAEPGTDFLYRLKVALRDDGPESSLPLGTAWVSLPSAPTPGVYYWTPASVPILKEFVVDGDSAAQVWGFAMRCWRRNTAILRSTLSAGGVRSPLLAEAEKAIEPSLAKLE
jgi:hypothetical protein